MSFTSKVQNYTNSTSSENILDALNRAVNYTVSIVAQANPGLLPAFANVNIITNNTTSIGFDYYSGLKAIHLLKVERADGEETYRQCQPVPSSQSRDAFDINSIYYALPDNPVYWISDENSLFMAPLATAQAKKGFKVTTVPDFSGRTINDAQETITQFPINFNELVVLHSAELILIERLGDFRAKLPTDLDADTTLFDQIADVSASISYTFPSSDFQDALDKAKNLVDGTTMGGDTEPESAQYWLADEDEDMTASTLQVASQELQRANAILGEFNAELGAQSTQKQQALSEFQANLQKKMALYDKIIQKITVDYQWTQGQLQLISAKKQEFVQINIGTAGIKDNPEESKAI